MDCDILLACGYLQFAPTPAAARALRCTAPATMVVQMLSAIILPTPQCHNRIAAPPIGAVPAFQLQPVFAESVLNWLMLPILSAALDGCKCSHRFVASAAGGVRFVPAV